MKFVVHKDTDQFVDKPCAGTKLMYPKNLSKWKNNRRYMKNFISVESLARFCKKHKEVMITYEDFYGEFVLCIQTDKEKL